MMAPKSDEQFKIIRDQRYEEISKVSLEGFRTQGFCKELKLVILLHL